MIGFIMFILLPQVGCSKLVIESSYNRLIAPPPLNSSKAIIRITITIHSILQVNKAIVWEIIKSINEAVQ